MKFLKYDTRFMMRGKLPRVGKARAKLARMRKKGMIGFFDLPSESAARNMCEALARRFRRRGMTDVLVIGIGGSDLGTKTLVRALDTRRGMCVSFLGNPDPEEVTHTLRGLDPKKTVVNVVSKSGETLEVSAVFLVVREWLAKGVGESKAGDRIVATTGDAGALRLMAEREGWATLPIPENVGGRYSVFSAVGLFPAACAGIDIRRLLAGAASQVEHQGQSERYAALQVLGWKKGLRISVIAPYSEALSVLSEWYAQLWSESLGKSLRVGPTPYPALGAVDQHSQLQLWMEGPKDKIITFIEVEKFRHRVTVPRGLGLRSGLELGNIVRVERAATAQALHDADRPNGTIFIPTISEETIGSLLQFFMQSTALAGLLFEVNPFNEPGVAAGKRLTRAFLERR